MVLCNYFSLLESKHAEVKRTRKRANSLQKMCKICFEMLLGYLGARKRPAIPLWATLVEQTNLRGFYEKVHEDGCTGLLAIIHFLTDCHGGVMSN